MGNIKIEKCILTGLDAKPIINDLDLIEYTVWVKKRIKIRLPFNALEWSEDPFIISNSGILYGLMYNQDWFDNEEEVISLEKLRKLINERVSDNPTERLDRLFLHLFELPKEHGKYINVNTTVYNDTFWKSQYFKSVEELNFYTKVLEEKGLIDATFSENKDTHGQLLKYRITYNGILHAVEIQNSGNASKNCFIAMSFKPETKEIRSAIKEAIISTGYTPVLVDEQNIDSDRTINDEIIAELKRCKFCVADFTFQSQGVYFESGFALGQRKKVIYTCQSENFAESHFDLKPLQHIIYKDPQELKKQLVLKIEAWIK